MPDSEEEIYSSHKGGKNPPVFHGTRSYDYALWCACVKAACLENLIWAALKVIDAIYIGAIRLDEAPATHGDNASVENLIGADSTRGRISDEASFKMERNVIRLLE